jgi:hypothetical protein
MLLPKALPAAAAGGNAAVMLLPLLVGVPGAAAATIVLVLPLPLLLCLPGTAPSLLALRKLLAREVAVACLSNFSSDTSGDPGPDFLSDLLL